MTRHGVAVVARSVEPDVLDALLTICNYDVVLLESPERAYGAIRSSMPELVVLFVGPDDLAGCQVLSMLTLDDATWDIPVVTVLERDERQGTDLELARPDGAVHCSTRMAVN